MIAMTRGGLQSLRHQLGSVRVDAWLMSRLLNPTPGECPMCGEAVTQTPKKKRRVFCSTRCVCRAHRLRRRRLDP